MRSLHTRTLIAATIFLALGLVVMFAAENIEAGIVLLGFGLVAFLFPWIKKAQIGPGGASIESSFEVDQLDLTDPNAPSLERESGGEGTSEEEDEDDEERDEA